MRYLIIKKTKFTLDSITITSLGVLLLPKTEKKANNLFEKLILKTFDYITQHTKILQDR